MASRRQNKTLSYQMPGTAMKANFPAKPWLEKNRKPEMNKIDPAGKI